MGFDTRFTLGIALVYLLNGVFNLFGQTGAFVPLIFLDNFLVALACILYAVLNPFKKKHLIFLLFSLYFTVQGLCVIGIIRNPSLEIGINIGFLSMLTLLYGLIVWEASTHKLLFVVPAIAFLSSFLLSFFDVSPLLKLGVSMVGIFTQLYILARPDIVERLSTLYKRFYLLTTLVVFFDLLYMLFILLN